MNSGDLTPGPLLLHRLSQSMLHRTQPQGIGCSIREALNAKRGGIHIVQLKGLREGRIDESHIRPKAALRCGQGVPCGSP